MTADPRALTELLEESQDLQADALRPTHEALDELVETAQAQREDDPAANQAFHETHTKALTSSLAGTALLGAAGGAVLVGALASAAAASSSSDVQILQTAASIENLAVSTYKTALTLPYIGGSSANPVVTKFAQVTMGQHVQHADAFNAAVKSLGGKAQTKPDPAFVPVVKKAVAGLGSATPAQGALGVVALALELENIAAETYVKDTVLAKKETNKALLASIMGIEAQHVAILLAVQALLMAGAPQLISLAPGTAAMLPGRGRQRRLPQRVLQDQQCRPGSTRSRQVSKNKTKKYEGSEHELQRPDARARRAAPRRRACPPWRRRSAAMRGTSRRTFLMGAGAAVAGGAALAVGSGALPSWPPPRPAALSRVRRCRLPPGRPEG